MVPRAGSAVVTAGSFWLLVLAGLAADPSPRVPAPEFEIRSWAAENGLPDDSVTSIQQTAEGFLWVGTARGLVRFDGWDFTPVVGPDASTPGNDRTLSITAQCVDAADTLWFGTERHGLFRLDPRQRDGLTAQRIGLETEKIFCLGADDEGGVWVGTERGLVKCEGGRLNHLPPEPGMPDPAVLALQLTRSNGVWVTTRSGLRRYRDGIMHRGEFEAAAGAAQKPAVLGVFEDRRGSLWLFGDTYLLNVPEGRRFNYFRGGGATLLQVWSICEGRAGQLWIGTSGQGLFHFAGGRFRAVDMQEGRGYSEVRTVFLDRDGQLWVGTQRGLVQLRERLVRWFQPSGSPATCLTEDGEGRVWAGFEHGGLASGKGGVLESAASLVPLAGQNLVTTIHAQPDGSLWVGTMGNGLSRIRDGRVLRQTTAHGLSDETVLAIASGSAGRVWVATGDGRVHRHVESSGSSYETADGLTGHPVTAMCAASEGGLWAGTAQGELLRFRQRGFRPLPPVPGFQGKLVSALIEDSERRLWVGTKGGGLACFGGSQWRVWKTEHGLPDNTIIGMQPLADGTLWVATARGVCRLTSDSVAAGPAPRELLPLLVPFPASALHAPRSMLHGPSSPSSSSGWPRSLRSRDGLLWFATDHGVVNFHPAELQRATRVPPVQITAIRANSLLHLESASPPSHPRAIRLPTGLRDLEIRFTAPSLGFPERTRFRHQLVGFDPDWQDSTPSRRARYGRLPPGDYQFLVEASDAEGAWSGRETELSLVLPAPLWRHPWVIALQLGVLITAAAGLARVVSHRRLRRQLAKAEQQRAMERERARIAQDMHDELGAKLTKISFLSERARNDLTQPARTSTQLDSIAATSRELLHSLDEIVWAVNPQNDTLEHLAAYLGQYAAEYLHQTSVEFDLRIPRALPAYPLSAEVRHHLFLSFKEALGNALKHSGATRVRVEMAVRGDAFSIQVIDNGRGLNPQTEGASTGDGAEAGRRRRGMGLSGMRERLAQVGGDCELQSTPDAGTTVILTIRLPDDEKKEL